MKDHAAFHVPVDSDSGLTGYDVSYVNATDLHTWSSGQATCPALWHDRLMLQLLGFIIDCPDPMKLAAFYSEVTGRAIMEGSSDNFAGITFGEVDLAFQRVEDYRPPRWPDDEHPKQYHLDFEVDEIEPEQRRVVKLGATLQKDFIGPEGHGWQVYTDPVGHPFCLCRHEGITWTDKGVAWP
jgi:predicted enzyme related to lactoylglutathione lyase